MASSTGEYSAGFRRWRFSSLYMVTHRLDAIRTVLPVLGLRAWTRKGCMHSISPALPVDGQVIDSFGGDGLQVFVGQPASVSGRCFCGNRP